MSTFYEEDVRRGMALLDQHRPGWRDEIDVHSLALADCERCVLGQLYGRYTDGVYELDLEDDGGEQFGFYTERSWAWLTRTWRRLLGV